MLLNSDWYKKHVGEYFDPSETHFRKGDTVRIKASQKVGKVYHIDYEFHAPYLINVSGDDEWHKANELEIVTFDEPDIMARYVESIK